MSGELGRALQRNTTAEMPRTQLEQYINSYRSLLDKQYELVFADL